MSVSIGPRARAESNDSGERCVPPTREPWRALRFIASSDGAKRDEVDVLAVEDGSEELPRVRIERRHIERRPRRCGLEVDGRVVAQHRAVSWRRAAMGNDIDESPVEEDAAGTLRSGDPGDVESPIGTSSTEVRR